MVKRFALPGLLAVGAILALFTLATAPQATPTDDLTLCPGQSATLPWNIALPPVPPALDILLAIDTTHSTGDKILDVRLHPQRMIQAMYSLSPGVRLGVAGIGDYPFDPYGIATDRVYWLAHPLTDDPAALVPVLQGLGRTRGESLYASTLRQAQGRLKVRSKPRSGSGVASTPYSALHSVSCALLRAPDYKRLKQCPERTEELTHMQ